MTVAIVVYKGLIPVVGRILTAYSPCRSKNGGSDSNSNANRRSGYRKDRGVHGNDGEPPRRSFRQDIDGRSQADSLCFLSIVLHGMPANSVPMPALASQSLFKLC